MKKNFFTVALLGIATLTGLLVACSESSSFENTQLLASDSEMVKLAKRIVMESGNVSFPTNQKTDGNASRSVAAYDTDATPLWDMAQECKEGDKTVLIVPLQGEEIRSHSAFSKNDVLQHQYAKASSFLITVSEGEKAYSYVKTCLPESCYATDNEINLTDIIIDPKQEGFTGIILNSTLAGAIYNGNRYEAGVLESIITKHKENCEKHHHDENCDHDHSDCDHKHENNLVYINLYAASQTLSRSTYTDGEEKKTICDFCGGDLDSNGFCTKCSSYSGEDFCIICLAPAGTCNCPNLDKPVEDVCPYCGRLYEYCTCEKEGGENAGTSDSGTGTSTPADTCSNCHKEPCICCDACGEVNCICETNTSPIVYVEHGNDKLIGEPICVESTTCCAMAVLEMAYSINEGSSMTQQSFYEYYTVLYGTSPDEGTILDRNSSFMTKYFSTSTTSNITNTVNNGDVVIINKGQHYVLAIGVQYDGDLIYADPDSGKILVANENYFSGCDNIVIVAAADTKSIKESELC